MFDLAHRIASNPHVFALSVSNVRGPAGTHYLAGGQIREVYSLAEIAPHHALRVSAISFAGRIAIGLCADGDAIPELPELAEGVETVAGRADRGRHGVTELGMRTIGLSVCRRTRQARRDGVARAPQALREADLATCSAHAEVHDYGDVTLPDPSPARDARSHVIDPDGLGALLARESPWAQSSPVPARDGNYGMANVSWWVLVGRRHSPAGWNSSTRFPEGSSRRSACLPAR
jgi:hypothetical protein